MELGEQEGGKKTTIDRRWRKETHAKWRLAEDGTSLRHYLHLNE